jgi:23S rRNA (guanine745-N1)-methyltransferase
VAPLLPRAGHGLLRCPVCRADLTGAPDALVCANRHRFDLARDGYVNLTVGRRPRAAAAGDTAEQLGHRAAFLDAGHFDPAIATLARQLAEDGAPLRVLDAGCGTGHHLARVIDALSGALCGVLSGPTIGLGLDIAVAAARGAARRWRAHAFAVADLWAAWPVRDQAIDVVISSFAPKNFAETARVLRPGGRLAVIHPGPEHLIELVRRFGLIGQQTDKADRYRAAAARWIGPTMTLRARHRATLDDATVRAAILMGPNARHRATAALGSDAAAMAVTIDLAIVVARKKRAG